MKYAIIYISKSGNTKLLANSIQMALSEHECVYFGDGDDFDPDSCNIIFVGSWCDKGTISEALKVQFNKLNNKQIALFATCGFGGSQKYFDDVAQRMINELPHHCKILGAYICQGKMPISIRKRYELMLNNENTKKQAKAFISNFDNALKHPNTKDLEQAKVFALQCMKGVYDEN